GVQKPILDSIDFDLIGKPIVDQNSGKTLKEEGGINALIHNIPPRAELGSKEAKALLQSAFSTFNDSLQQLTTFEATTDHLLPGLISPPISTIIPSPEVATLATKAQSQLHSLRQLIERTLQDIEEIRTPEGGRSTLTGIRGSVDNIATYPVL